LFYRNKAQDDGGGSYFDSCSLVIMTNVTQDDNEAGDDGGACKVIFYQYWKLKNPKIASIVFF
jgi:hypothetical protein